MTMSLARATYGQIRSRRGYNITKPIATTATHTTTTTSPTRSVRHLTNAVELS
jgi:hypothetical protein